MTSYQKEKGLSDADYIKHLEYMAVLQYKMLLLQKRILLHVFMGGLLGWVLFFCSIK